MKVRAGVDLGGTKIQVVIVDDQNAILGQARRPTPLEGGPPGVAEEIVAAVREASEAAGVEPDSLGAIGVGSPGAVDGPRERLPTLAISRIGRASFRSGRG